MSRFNGKVAIITGSSNGIGRATAVLLAQEGAKVTITGRNAERLEETNRQILAAGIPASNVNSVVADVTTAAGQNELINSTVNKFGKLDILVNNAGAALPDSQGRTGLLHDIRGFHGTIALNVASVIELIQKARPHLTATKGDIVNVSSIVGLPLAQPVFTYYSMAKSALDQLTRSSAIELIDHGIRVNSVSPGVVVTGFGEAMGMPAEASKKFYNYLQSHKDCIPTLKAGIPEDIANVIAFLADRRISSYIVGQSIVADGGTSLVLAANSHDLSAILSSK